MDGDIKQAHRASELRLVLPPESLQEAVNRAVAAQLEPALRRLKLVDKRQGAALLGVSDKQFCLLMRRQGIRTISLGPKLARWSLADIETLIAAGVQAENSPTNPS